MSQSTESFPISGLRGALDLTPLLFATKKHLNLVFVLAIDYQTSILVSSSGHFVWPTYGQLNLPRYVKINFPVMAQLKEEFLLFSCAEK
jgi:hypothetical protein